MAHQESPDKAGGISRRKGSVADAVEKSAPPDPDGAAEAPTEVIGKSNFNVGQFLDSFREIAKEAATEAAKEVVLLIIKEIGTPADAGFPDIPEEKSRRFKFLSINWTRYSPLIQ